MLELPIGSFCKPDRLPGFFDIAPPALNPRLAGKTTISTQQDPRYMWDGTLDGDFVTGLGKLIRRHESVFAGQRIKHQNSDAM